MISNTNFVHPIQFYELASWWLSFLLKSYWMCFAHIKIVGITHVVRFLFCSAVFNLLSSPSSFLSLHVVKFNLNFRHYCVFAHLISIQCIWLALAHHIAFFHLSAQWAFVLIFNNISPFCCCCCQHLCASYAFLLLWLLTVLYHRDWFSVKYTCVHVLWHCQSLAHRCSFWSFLLWIGLCVFVCMQSWFIRAVRCRCISHHWYLYIVIQIRERAECAYGWCLSQLR